MNFFQQKQIFHCQIKFVPFMFHFFETGLNNAILDSTHRIISILLESNRISSEYLLAYLYSGIS